MCDKTKVAGICTVALPNRPADCEAGGSGAAAAGWAGPSQLEVFLACYITYVQIQKKIYGRFPAICLMIYHRQITPLSMILPMPVSPSGMSGISAFPFRTCQSLDEL